MKAIKTLGFIAATIILFGRTNQGDEIPYWLSDYKELYEKDPIEASGQWFKDAKMGMFVHFNLASLMELGSVDYKLWIQGEADDRILDYVGISKDDYMTAKSKDSLLFTKFKIPEFDAEEICRLAVKAKMKYITFTAHHFTANFDSEHIPFTSANSSPTERYLKKSFIFGP